MNIKKHLPWIIPVAIVVIVIMWAVGAYNGMVTLDEGVQGKWADVETQYQRRADLIPNLVSTVKTLRPIPANEISANSSISDQNPGY